MIERTVDVVIVGSGAGGGTVAQEIAPLVRDGLKVVLFEQGARLEDHEFDGSELEMSADLYEDGGGFLTADGAMTLAFGRAYGGSTVVYTGTSLIAPGRVIRRWSVPGLEVADIEQRSRKFMAQNGVHFLPRVLLNENNKLFAEGCVRAGFHAEQFPLNLLGCPNAAKMGTHRVQLPNAEAQGVEVVTRAEVLRLEDHAAVVRVTPAPAGRKGRPSSWAPGEYRVTARMIVLCGGAVGTPALLLRSPATAAIAHVGHGFTCHPAHILVAEHDRPITNDVGHPKSYYVDRAAEDGYVLETCMYFPFVTAKNLTGFGNEHAQFMRRFPRLQMILVLACDRAIPENRVTVDKSGRPVVHYTFTPAVIRSFVAATRAAARIFFAAGALRVHAPEAEPTAIDRRDAYRLDDLIRDDYFLAGRTSVSAAHLMGGCGMGRGEGSVTDSRGRIAGFPWLRVADASLFPDALEINPYLTIMALADRVAEGIRREIGALDPVPVT
jgi:choline dehydrogenase-like flavoprotein